jgi:hypothetical protein
VSWEITAGERPDFQTKPSGKIPGKRPGPHPVPDSSQGGENRFEEFLKRKNIDALAFSEQEPEQFQRWEHLFAQMHEESFVMQQKFILNPIRRRFPSVRHPAVHDESKSSD